MMVRCSAALMWLAVWLSGNALASINVVVLRQPRLVKVKVKVNVFIWHTFCSTSHSRRSGTDHTVLPANYTVPASTS